MENSAQQPRSLTELLTDLKGSLIEENVRVSTILEGFHERGFGFFLFALSLPSAIPIPAMGMHTVVSIPMLLLTGQQAIGRHTVWMPDIILRQTVKRDLVKKILEHCIPWSLKLEKICRPRMGFMTQGIWSHIIGILGFLMVACIAVPLPLTNTVPAIGLIFMSAGVLVRDGLAVLIGAIVGTVWSLAWFIGFIYFGKEGLEWAWQHLTSFFS